MIVATTRAALLRGTTATDALGDEIEDNTTPVAGWDDFAISIIEKDEQAFDQASASWRTIEKLIGRPVKGTLPVDDGDRIKDLRDGTVYAVSKITRTARGLSGRASVTLELRRTAP